MNNYKKARIEELAVVKVGRNTEVEFEYGGIVTIRDLRTKGIISLNSDEAKSLVRCFVLVMRYLSSQCEMGYWPHGDMGH